MKIEKVAKSEKNKEFFVVSFENESNIKVSTAQIADFGLYSGREFTTEEYKELINAIALSSSKTRALRILGNRSLSARDMEKRLTEKGGSVDAARETVEWLIETGMINDTEYASSIVKHYSVKGYGPARIKDELYKRGIPREMWDDAIGGLEDGTQEEAAVEFIRQKLKGGREKDDVRSVKNALCRRGFSYEDAGTAVRRYLEEADETI